jgi:hypothetical protein
MDAWEFGPWVQNIDFNFTEDKHNEIGEIIFLANTTF